MLVGAGQDPTAVHLYGGAVRVDAGSAGDDGVASDNRAVMTLHNPRWNYDAQRSKFGAAVAMNVNGQRLLVGDPHAEAAYLYDEHGHLMHTFRDPSSDCCGAVARIRAFFRPELSPSEDGDNVETLFGTVIDISEDGSVVVIGAEGAIGVATVNARGAVYVYTQTGEGGSNGNTWTVQTVLEPWPKDGTKFGISVALNRKGTMLAVGANAPNITRGAVYLYELRADLAHDVHGRSTAGSSYQHVWTLNSPNVDSSQWFGSALDLTDDYVVVGARGDVVHEQYGAGAVYVFDMEGRRLVDSITQPSGPIANAGFGASVAMQGDRLLLTSSMDGTAYAYDMVESASDDGTSRSNKHAVLVGKYPVPTNPGYAGGTVALSGDGSLGVVGVPQALGKSGFILGAAFAICFPEIAGGHNRTITIYECPHLHLFPVPWYSLGFWNWDSSSGRILALTIAVLISLFLLQYRRKRQRPPQARQTSSTRLGRRQQQRHETARLTAISEIELVEDLLLS